jgi:hypothetical protein
MPNLHITAGIVIVVVGTTFFLAKYLRAPKRAAFPAWGWAGLAVIVGAELGLVFGVGWIGTFFTPTAWTGYLLLTDGCVRALRGRSRLVGSAGQFFALAFWSVPLWLIFEAYNLRMRNWSYTGLPPDPVLDALGYVWSFATIWPGIFETADLIAALGFFRASGKQRAGIRTSTLVTFGVLGLAMLIIPLLVAEQYSRYLFALVWAGFILLLEPLNYAWGGESLLGDWQQGRRTRLEAFLASGVVCGFLWEFWNYWAGAKWRYLFPIGQGWKIFEMPLPGYLGFPAFALECFVMYEFLRTVRRKMLPHPEKNRLRATG